MVVGVINAQGQEGSGDPLADAARKARQQKKNEAAPKKVYTEDDFKKTTNPDATGQTAAGNPQNASSSTDATLVPPKNAVSEAATGGDPKDKGEESWRKRFKGQRDKIARAEKELDILQREKEKAQVQYYSDPQKALQEQYTRSEINEKDAKILAQKHEIEQLKQGLSDLEDELRKSGGDSGWSRE
ncbi:MAG: hypothetical protein NVS9B4_11920 [Candidatus Acidiferrum sp.]